MWAWPKSVPWIIGFVDKPSLIRDPVDRYTRRGRCLKPVSFSKHVPATGSPPLLPSLGAAAALLAAAFRLSGGPTPVSQATLPPEHLHGVLSRARLSPPLRGPARHMRFSGNGKFLIVQVESGIY